MSLFIYNKYSPWLINFEKLHFRISKLNCNSAVVFVNLKVDKKTSSFYFRLIKLVKLRLVESRILVLKKIPLLNKINLVKCCFRLL